MLRKFYGENLSFIEDNNLAILEYYVILFNEGPSAYDYLFNQEKERGWLALSENDRRERENNFLGGISEIIAESAVQALKYK